MTTIASSLEACLNEFVSLLESENLARFDNEVSIQPWKDELGRLHVWTANIGAHKTGQSSLDYRLRDASHLKMETLKLLENLQDTLQDLKEVIEEGSDTSEDGEDEDEAEFDIEFCENEGTEVQQIHRGLVEVINYLYRISMAIRRPARHDLWSLLLFGGFELWPSLEAQCHSAHSDLRGNIDS